MDFFITQYPQFVAQKASHILSPLQESAFEQLKQLTLPTTKHEEWKYTNLRQLAQMQFQAATAAASAAPALPEGLALPADSSVLVFVNGVFQADFSKIKPQAGLKVYTWAEALQAAPELLLKHFGKIAQDTSSNYFNALNTAYAHEGTVLHVEKNKVIEAPVFIYYLGDTSQNFNAQHRNLWVLEENSQARIIELYQSSGEGKGFFNQVSEISLAAAARLDYYKIQNESAGELYHINLTEVQLHDKSYFAANTLSFAGRLVRNNLHVRIAGQHCEAFLNGLTLLDGQSHTDHHTLVDHQQPNSYSNELYKGIFDGKATGVFNGKIYVQQDAQKTNAFQQNRNILLSKEAGIYTKPQLEIWADDVKCSHGATTGQLDEDALFYLRARGISLDSARALLMQAFAGEVLERISLDFLREWLEGYITQRLLKA
jgi:Fe-S cluster assembly protein SufD